MSCLKTPFRSRCAGREEQEDHVCTQFSSADARHRGVVGDIEKALEEKPCHFFWLLHLPILVPSPQPC